MNRIVTSAIVISRLNYGESDKIITVITPEHGKVRLMARGVRKVKSKLAGGIELFSVSNITFIQGRGDISTLVSTRLQTHFHHIVSDIDRTMASYDVLSFLNTSTQDSCDIDYYRLLLQTLTYLNDTDIPPNLTKCWFMLRLLQLLGHPPNVEKTIDKKVFEQHKQYRFIPEESSFIEDSNGSLSANHIKVLSLFAKDIPQRLQVISGLQKTLPQLEQLLSQLVKQAA